MRARAYRSRPYARQILSSVIAPASRIRTWRASRSLLITVETIRAKVVHQVVLALTQRRLVGDLEEVPHELRPSPSKPRVVRPTWVIPRSARSISRVSTSPGSAEARRRGAPCPRSSGRRQVAELFVVGEVQLASQVVVQAVHDGPAFGQAEPRDQALEPHVVLFVDHHRDRVLPPDGHPGPVLRRLVPQELGRHQPPLEEEALRPPAELVHAHHVHPAAQRSPAHGGRHLPEDGLAVARARPRSVAVALEVPGQPDAGRQHDVGVLADGVEPAKPEVRNGKMVRAQASAFSSVPDLIAKHRRALEVLRLDGVAQASPQPLQAAPALGDARVGGKVYLAAVPARAVNAAQQPPQPGLERRVALGAPQSAGLPEVVEGHLAEAARGLRRLGPPGARLAQLRQELGDVHTRGRVGRDALLLGAPLAQIMSWWICCQ